jgi:putative peptide maturation dehydrogenase
MRVRRARYLFFSMDDLPFLDIPLLLSGRVALTQHRQLYALSLLRGEQYPITLDEIRTLFGMSSAEWVDAEAAVAHCNIDTETLMRLVDQGLVVSDSEEAQLSRLREAEEQIVSDQWNAYASLYHYMTRWRGVSVEAYFPSDTQEWKEYSESNEHNEEVSDVYRRFLDRNGRPPAEFHQVHNSKGIIELPLVKRTDGLFDILEKRRTTRAFERNTPLTLENFSLLLFYVFGCHGTVDVFDGIIGLKKTSPSGGCLHPTEVYPLVLNVLDVQPGVYHYSVRSHTLELIQALKRDEAEEWASEFTAGQSFFQAAQVLFLMTTRFYRNYWKYRKHPKAYSVLLMDAAHLSQTFYLLAAELGLGAFVTAAVNSVNVEERLGLDGFQEGAILICGCGSPSRENYIDPSFRSYHPDR